MTKHYERNFEKILRSRLAESPQFIQVILGPRQVGKTSGVQHVLEKYFLEKEYSYLTAEESIDNHDWILNSAQKALQENKKIIVFDEIQKIERWSESIKLIYDRIKKNKQKLHIVILGSSSLELTLGLNESLAGRFEAIHVYHWSFFETNEAFDIGFYNYLEIGGYPGSYLIKDDKKRFRNYLIESIFEAVVAKDILRYAQVKKPALFRQVFQLISQYSGREVSYNKLLGQLQEAGNVDQIKYYLELYEKAFLIRQIRKFAKTTSSRKSSPKLLIGAPVYSSVLRAEELSKEEMGFVFESVVGNRLCENFDEVFYWRDGVYEVDFVVKYEKIIYAIEVKSHIRKTSGIKMIKERFNNVKSIYIDFGNYIEFEKDPVSFLKKYSM